MLTGQGSCCSSSAAAAAAAGRRRRGSRSEAVADRSAAAGQQPSAAHDVQGQPAQMRARTLRDRRSWRRHGTATVASTKATAAQSDIVVAAVSTPVVVPADGPCLSRACEPLAYISLYVSSLAGLFSACFELFTVWGCGVHTILRATLCRSSTCYATSNIDVAIASARTVAADSELFVADIHRAVIGGRSDRA